MTRSEYRLADLDLASRCAPEMRGKARVLSAAVAPVTVPSVDGLDPTRVVHPDVVDRSRRLALEADSWEFHSSKTAFQRDCWRYTVLVVEGWTVLRFTWWQVVHHREWVIARLRAVAARHAGRAA